MDNKKYVAINVTGFTTGIASCLPIFLIVQFETSFDHRHKKKDDIYRVVTNTRAPKLLVPPAAYLLQRPG